MGHNAIYLHQACDCFYNWKLLQSSHCTGVRRNAELAKVESAMQAEYLCREGGRSLGRYTVGLVVFRIAWFFQRAPTACYTRIIKLEDDSRWIKLLYHWINLHFSDLWTRGVQRVRGYKSLNYHKLAVFFS